MRIVQSSELALATLLEMPNWMDLFKADVTGTQGEWLESLAHLVGSGFNPYFLTLFPCLLRQNYFTSEPVLFAKSAYESIPLGDKVDERIHQVGNNKIVAYIPHKDLDMTVAQDVHFVFCNIVSNLGANGHSIRFLNEVKTRIVPIVVMPDAAVWAIVEKGAAQTLGKMMAFCNHDLFHNVTNAFEKIEFTGSKGVLLNDVWKEGPEAYLGTTVSGFPNVFLMTGPNTGLGHSSMVYMIESQANYILDAVEILQNENKKSIEVKEEVQEKFNVSIDEKMKNTVWKSGCQSWYLTPKGRNATLWPGFTFQFKKRTLKINLEDYNLK